MREDDLETEVPLVDAWEGPCAAVLLLVAILSGLALFSRTFGTGLIIWDVPSKFPVFCGCSRQRSSLHSPWWEFHFPGAGEFRRRLFGQTLTQTLE